MSKTAAIYARFSSDLQKDRSVDDQAAMCGAVAKREGYKVIATYNDRAKSGASMFERDGLLDLMTSAKKRGFNAVIVESLDRLSRDQEDLAGIFKRLKFCDIKILTCNEGETTDLHVGIRGIVGSLFLADMGNKIRRGHNGRVREGLFPGAVTYGYRLVPGKPGEREIDPVTSKVVQRIFRDYAEGKPTRQIAADLTRDKIPTPSGLPAWNHQTFVGGRGGKRGMIGNRLYAGVLVWNANRTVMNPENGRKQKRKANPDDLIVTDVPHLRIIDQPLWDLANGVCAGRAESKFGLGGKRPGIQRTMRDHMLAGLLVCGQCGSHMRIAQSSRGGGSRVACAAAHQHSTCEHMRSYDLPTLQKTILDGMKVNLTNTKALVEYTKVYYAKWAERQKENSTERETVQRSLNRVTVQIDRYITAIGDSTDPIPAMMDRLRKLETERVGLEEKLRLINAETGGSDNIVSLHPAAIETFRANIEAMHTALSSDMEPEPLAPFRAAFRNVFDRMVVHPTRKRMPYEVTPYARLSAILGVDLFPKGRTAEEMLAEQGVAYSNFGGSGKAGLPKSQHSHVISLGRWRAAA
jgi:site-specific DNA recombinase